MPRIPTLNKKIVLHQPCGIISHDGRVEIQHYISEKIGVRLPNWWGWVSRIPNEKRRKYIGSFSKRVGRYVRSTTGKKVSSQHLGTIGSLVEQHSNLLDEEDFIIDFTDKFDWKDGDFGDEESCFWGSNDEALQKMEEGGVLAVRFFTHSLCYDEYRGYARAWMFPTFVKKRRCFIVFNGYGLQTSQIVNIVSPFLKCAYKNVPLKNNAIDGGLIYINGGSGFLLGERSVISSVKKWDMKIKTSDIVCGMCGAYVEYEDSYEIIDNIIYCHKCFSKRFFECDGCGNIEKRKNISFVYLGGQYYMYPHHYCKQCITHVSIPQCKKCGVYTATTPCPNENCPKLPLPF